MLHQSPVRVFCTKLRYEPSWAIFPHRPTQEVEHVPFSGEDAIGVNFFPAIRCLYLCPVGISFFGVGMMTYMYAFSRDHVHAHGIT